MARDRPAFPAQTAELAEKLRPLLHTLESDDDLDPLMEHVGEARFVLLGEASHGTSEYYRWRARLSKRLIREKGFSFIAVEGDWPDCYRVNRYVKDYDEAGESAEEVLHDFERWPTWMWANWEVVALAEWLRTHNASVTVEHKVGFYGLDVYSLWESLDAIIGYLEEKGSNELEAARDAFRCFEPYGEAVQAYARATALVPSSCEDEVVELLQQLRRGAGEYPGDGEARFNAEQNAYVLQGAEQYYRAMVHGGPGSWNVRDRHMADTIDRLMKQHGPGAKAIIWEHNTHVGDARATDMSAGGMINVGQLTRQRHATEGVVLCGFGSHRGSVIAGDYWGAPMEKMKVPSARADSWEAVFHETGATSSFVLSRDMLDPAFMQRRGHRAIGVVYQPDYEFLGNYVPTVLPERYDAFIFLDETAALHPLHLMPETREVPDTYPWGL